MKIHFTTLLKSIIYGAITPVIISCTNDQNDNNLLSYIDTRVGTAASTTHTAGMFGKHTEEYGQTLPAVLEPNGMNFWTPQTQDTELKCIAPYYYRDSLFQGFRNSHWIVGGCTLGLAIIKVSVAMLRIKTVFITMATLTMFRQEASQVVV